MAKLRQLSPDLWPLIDVILFSYIEFIFRGGVSCLPAALLFIYFFCKELVTKKKNFILSNENKVLCFFFYQSFWILYSHSNFN